MAHLSDSASPNTLAIALVVPDPDRRSAIRAAMEGSQSAIVRELVDYPALGCSLNADVMVVDLDHDTTQAIRVIEDICGRIPGTTVMACSARNDAALLRRAMQAGAREFLIEPLTREIFAEALTRARARQPQQKKSAGKILLFVPTKGGVGASTLTANFALTLTMESAARVVVVDMNFQFGEIALGLGITPQFSVVDALRNVERLDWDFLSTLLVRHSSGLSVLASPEKYNFFHLSSHEGAARLFRILRQEFDYVVVDAGTCHGHLQEALFEMADRLYLITELSLPALRNANRIIHWLSSSDRALAMEVVVNRFDSRHGDIDEASAAKAIGRQIDWRIANSYAAARSAQDNGVPLAMENSAITKVLVQMARAACGKPVKVQKKPSGGFSFFGSRTLAEIGET